LFRNGEWTLPAKPNGAVALASFNEADYAELRFGDALVEADNYDLLVMGRTQGKGCYCFVNGLLNTQVTKYAKNYRYIVVDNEAGLEHLSRGVLPQVDTILLVSDCSRRGVQAAGRLSEMIMDLKLGAKEVGLIINRAPGGQITDGVRAEIDKYGMKLVGVVPHDDTVYEYDAEGKPSVTVPADAPVKQAVHKIFDQLAL